MKKRNTYLFAVLSAVVICACKKTETKPTIAPPNFNKPDNGCLLNETSETLGLFDLTFVYNANGDPQTFAGFTVSYDSKNRLEKIQYSSSYYRVWQYNDNTFLPALSNLYYKGVLNGTDIFTYDTTGKLEKWDRIYVNQYAAGETIWNYTYDSSNNVTAIKQAGVNTPIFNATAYDGKPNFAGANEWVKYILIEPETGYALYPYLLFSANNAKNWSLGDSRNGLVFSAVQSYYQYDSNGFAIKDSTIFEDPVNGNIPDVQSNSFTCK